MASMNKVKSTLLRSSGTRKMLMKVLNIQVHLRCDRYAGAEYGACPSADVTLLSSHLPQVRQLLLRARLPRALRLRRLSWTSLKVRLRGGRTSFWAWETQRLRL